METKPEPEYPIYRKYTRTLTPRNERTIWDTGIEETEKFGIDEKWDVPRLIRQRKRRLVKNLFLISLTKTASYLLRETIVTNWLDENLIQARNALSNLMLILVTPLFVPQVLKNLTVRSSLRLAVLWLTLMVLTSYRPFPYIFFGQVLLCTFAESVLGVAIPLYMVRIARIWSRINGIGIGTTILRVFALQDLLFQLKQIVIATMEYLHPEISNLPEYDASEWRNVSCGASYCSPSINFVTEYVYGTRLKIFEGRLSLLPIIVAVSSALIAIILTIVLDQLGTLSKSEFGEQPKVCKTIHVFLQLCRPRMTYLLGISLYQPFLLTLRRDYLEAYASCGLPWRHDLTILLLVTISAIHATLSAEIFHDLLETVGSLQLIVAIFTTTFVLLSVSQDAQTLNVLAIFIVCYILQYWTSMYGLFVVLLTEQLIGDEETAAWSIYATIFWVGLTLSQALRYMCMNSKLQVMIVFGIVLLSMTFFLRREIKRALFAIIPGRRIIEAFKTRSKAWISEPRTDLSKAIEIGGRISWIETFWRRTVLLVIHASSDRAQHFDEHEAKKRFYFVESRSEN